MRRDNRWKLGFLLLVGLTGVALAGCGGRETPAPPPVPTVAGAPTEPLPATESVVLIDPESGGVVALGDRAEVRLPAQSLDTKAAVTLRAVQSPPPAPLPRSILGRVYEVALEEGELTGVALVRLPLGAEISADQYDLSPYHWNGTGWERVTGRSAGDAVQFGVSAPGLYCLQGQWKLADATLALIRTPTVPGQQTVPLTVVGQYRYSAVPALEGEYIQARLTLKQDTSGGAGRIGGNDQLDRTVDEATLWFKPDPAQSQGTIEFSQAFEVGPSSIDLAPGASANLYAVLTVEDAAAPTRRLSTAVDYAQVLPIQAVGMDIVRPLLAVEGQNDLRWHVRLNGQTLLVQEAAATSLPLDPILAQGGLGEYRVTLEGRAGDAWVAVSNEVTVQLRVPPTATPALPQPSEGTMVAIVTPTPVAGGPSPTAGPPPTPTRRPGPGGTPVPTGTSTPAVSPSPSPSATPTRPAWASVFWADRYSIASGECTTLRWSVENVISVFLDGAPVTGNETRQVCPTSNTTYTLRITSSSGTQDRTVTITVAAANTAAIEFTADDYQISIGQCTTLRWRVTNVRAVFLNGQGVSGESSREVCPAVDTDYDLRIEDNSGSVSTRRISIKVMLTPAVNIKFWAEQYTLVRGACTTLHWSTSDVREVYLDNQGVAGVGTAQACPDFSQNYVLKVINTEGETTTKELTLEGNDPGLTGAEVIAQGIVNEVTRLADVDPINGGDQPGYRLLIDGINPLFAGLAGWAPAAVTLSVQQTWIELGEGGPVMWPIGPGQLVEFRASCDVATCRMPFGTNVYLYLRSD